MGKYIVMDIVFKAASLNYDQGSGNYQELKKITRWNGKQYTFVSRYALRYSMLETGKEMGILEIAEGDKLQLAGEGNKKVIQPATELLISGEILKYPEFDLFGYLITSTYPQNFRTAPVKISHAISMTPFNYDALFNANIGMANRVRKKHGDMSPNPFTAEEHETYYLYSVVIDVNSVGKIEVYLSGKKDVAIAETKEGSYEFKIGKGKDRIEFFFDTSKPEDIKMSEIVIPLKEDKVEGDGKEKLKNIITYDDGLDTFIIKYSLNEEKIKERIEDLIRAILKLHRSIKGRNEDLTPKLLVLGLYNNTPYQTFKDRIALVDENIEETYDEITEITEEGKKIVKIIHKTVKEAKPKFRIYGDFEKAEVLKEEKIIEKIGGFLDKGEEEKCTEIEIFKLPEIDIEFSKEENQ